MPGQYAFGEIIRDHLSEFGAYLSVAEMDYYDFPLVRTMREAFAFGGDLRILKDPKERGRALDGPKAVTFVRNHDIDRGQANDRGHHRSRWPEQVRRWLGREHGGGWTAPTWRWPTPTCSGGRTGCPTCSPT